MLIEYIVLALSFFLVVVSFAAMITVFEEYN